MGRSSRAAVLHGVRQDLPGQVVVTLRQHDRDLSVRAPVQLRRATRPRTAPSGQPPELGVQQPFLDQLVQVELRGVTGQLDARGGLVPTHRVRLRDDEEIQRATGRLGERADARDLRDEVIQPIHTF